MDTDSKKIYVLRNDIRVVPVWAPDMEAAKDWFTNWYKEVVLKAQPLEMETTPGQVLFWLKDFTRQDLRWAASSEEVRERWQNEFEENPEVYSVDYPKRRTPPCSAIGRNWDVHKLRIIPLEA